MDTQESTIIVKKIKKVHKGGHGGSWKIAYADFVTALMSLFLLLWLVGSIPPEKKGGLAKFVENYSPFNQAGESPISDGDMRNGNGVVSGGDGFLIEFKQKREEAITMIVTELMTQLGDLKDHVKIIRNDNEFRINIVDNEGTPMFPSGETEPTDAAKKILKKIVQSLTNTNFSNFSIVIEGHTDANPFNRGNITNWELSILRAAAARRELVSGGLEPTRIKSVTGFSDTKPLLNDDPRNPQNRRISLLLIKQ